MQLIVSFIAVMLPVVVFLVASNWYAKNVVRDKVSETYRNTLDLFVSQTDRQLQQIDEYLYKMSVMDPDTGLLMSYPYGSDEYVLTKIRIQNKLIRDVGFYNLIDTIFVVHENDLLLYTSGTYPNVREIVKNKIYAIIKQGNPDNINKWLVLKDDRMPGKDFLVRITNVTDNLYVGAIIRAADILGTLSILWDKGAIGESSIYHSDGSRLAEPLANARPTVPLTGSVLQNHSFQTVTNRPDGESYMVMSRSSQVADITASIAIPEKQMLKGLPFFQKATYFMTIGVVLIFALYLFFIRRMVLGPMQQLIGGMKKIAHGMLDVRLKTADTAEFHFLASTFNSMAEQIKTLKIGMYEEQLRGQKIELKQLQAQINPHFYMNSLNIIYNFAALKDYESVKKMSLHLADYFRFIMRINRDLISLDEELKHIASYIEIQKFRFPNKLECRIDIPGELMQLQLPALTLQPFVENAIIHGFVNRRKPFHIVIAGELQTGEAAPCLLLTVRDNGVGFPEDVLERLNNDGSLPQSPDTSRLGILNVVQRLKLRYGGSASVVFGSDAESGGAVVGIKVPVPAKLPEPEPVLSKQLSLMNKPEEDKEHV